MDSALSSYMGILSARGCWWASHWRSYWRSSWWQPLSRYISRRHRFSPAPRLPVFRQRGRASFSGSELTCDDVVLIFSRTFVQRARAAAFWAVPPLLALALYWPGLTAWFQKDDFVWLGLRDMVVSWRSFWWALFAPLAQGTIRTLSE